MIEAKVVEMRAKRSKDIDTDKLVRIRLLSAELEVQRQLAIDRTKSIDSKAGFLVVAGGLLATLTFPDLADGTVVDIRTFLALIPVTAALAVTLLATTVLWPLPLKELGPHEFVRRWIKSCEPTIELEDYILEVKAKTIAFRNDKNEARAARLKLGFIFLVGGIVTAIVAGVVQSIWR